MSQYKKILVAIDINSEYKDVIKKAMAICDSVADLNLVYIPIPTVYIQPYLYGVEYNEINDFNRSQRAKEKLLKIANDYNIPQDNVLMKTGTAADEIKQFANEISADLIVIGTHGQSGLKLLLGSTANAVLHGVEQDVLAVRIYKS